MNNYVKLINNFNELKMNCMADNVEQYMNAVSSGQRDYIDALYDLTELQLKAKRKKEIDWCIKWGSFPFKKTFEDFDFSFQPSIKKDEIMTFKTLAFMEKAENIIFVGSPGVGKTHLAISIGLEAASQKQTVRFINCNDLILQLKKAYEEGHLDYKLKLFSRYKILIIDEIGYLPIDELSAHLLFQLINKRYEKRSTIVSTNVALSKWGEMFKSNVMANAILDRLVHHSHIISITGKSYRMKDLILPVADKTGTNS